MSSGFSFSRNSLVGEWESFTRVSWSMVHRALRKVGTETHSMGGARVPSWCSRSVCRSLSTSP